MPDLSDIIANYFERGYRFRRIEAENAIHAQSPKAVFLIHGWGVRAVSMNDLAYALANLDFTVFNYDYPTAERNIKEHSQIFLDLYRRTLRREHITRKVYFLTHSMGGILLRSAMAKMSEAECRKIEAIVMLGPPNQGSVLASLGRNGLVRSFNASLADMTTDRNSFVRNIPPPPFLPPVGIIAGRFDGKVALRNTALPDGQSYQCTVVDCTHPGLRDPGNTLSPILKFFRKKSFQ